MFQRPEYGLVPPELLDAWTESASEELQVVMEPKGAHDIRELIPSPADRARTRQHTKHQTRVVHGRGVPILAGTDCSVFGLVWGHSLHRELQLMVEAGLSPYEALGTATRVPAEVMGDGDAWGTIASGKRADVVLLGEDPLEDIAHTRGTTGVMARGRYYLSATLEQMVARR